MEAIFEDCVHLTVNHSDNFINSKLMNIEEFVEKTLNSEIQKHFNGDWKNTIFLIFSTCALEIRIIEGVIRQNYFSPVLSLHGDLIFRK